MGLAGLLVLTSACSTYKWSTLKNGDRTPASLMTSDGKSVQALVNKGLAAGKAHVVDEVIVQYFPGTTEKDKTRAMNKITGNRKEILFMGHNGKDLELIKFTNKKAMAQIINDLLADPAVDFAEPNWIVKHTETSNDTYYTNGSLWGMYGDSTTPANVYGSRAAKAWGSKGANCSSVIVGIIDEGYMYTHPDIAANAFTNPLEVAGNGIDDDGNGYVDDVYGWDFDGNNNTVFDGAGDDHGTHVAGTIGGVGGNAQGVAGVCWQVKLMDAKFLGSRGGTTANAIKAVDYFTNLKVAQGLNIVATNNSWGGGGYSQGLADAITRAGNQNILFIAAAGNETNNNDAVTSYPSGYPNDNIIAVAALTSTGALASYSNWGATSVDLGAPGSGIWSTVPKSSKGKVVASYASYNGTSMATPHVTGAAAYYKAMNPSATAADIKNALLNAASATPTPSLSGKVLTGGRLNIENF